MAGGSSGETRSLEQTPTWAVAAVCFVLVLVSIIIEHVIHLIAKWLKKRHKRALHEALEKIKSELMLMGFISLLLTVLQSPISKICIPQSVGNSWHPCKESKSSEEGTSTKDDSVEGSGRKLLWMGARRILAGGGTDKCAARGKVSLISTDGIHQLHIFIFVLAVFHVLYCVATLALGRLKEQYFTACVMKLSKNVTSHAHGNGSMHLVVMGVQSKPLVEVRGRDVNDLTLMRSWKSWERETKTVEYQFTHDPERFRFARDTSFGRRHLNFWTRSPLLIWIVCFFRQFVRSVPKVDYLTLRHGFITAHLAPNSAAKFDFQKYIKRSLEEDFKVVVGISPAMWFCAVLFLLSNTHDWHASLWLPFIPLIVILLVATKLQVIITRMGLQIQDRGDVVVKGVPIVQPADEHFWFNSPRLVLFLIHFVLFQNAFQLAFFVWTWYEFGLRSCFHKHLEDVIIRISMGVLIQILCSYVTLPLYALVTQMGSKMKPTIFNERVATALRKWHHTAKKHVKESRRSSSVTPLSTSRPATPSRNASPVHLLRHYRGEVDSLQASPRFYGSDNERWDVEGSPSPSHHTLDDFSSHHHDRQQGPNELQERENTETPSLSLQSLQEEGSGQHEIKINSMDFSFSKR